MLDDLGVERLSRRIDLAQRDWPTREIELDELAPDRRRRAERGDAVRDEVVEHRARLEATRQREHRRAGVPWRKKARPGVLGPARRGNVEMGVAGPQAEAEHRREMADGIARMAVQHQLG